MMADDHHADAELDRLGFGTQLAPTGQLQTINLDAEPPDKEMHIGSDVFQKHGNDWYTTMAGYEHHEEWEKLSKRTGIILDYCATLIEQVRDHEHMISENARQIQGQFRIMAENDGVIATLMEVKDAIKEKSVHEAIRHFNYIRPMPDHILAASDSLTYLMVVFNRSTCERCGKTHDARECRAEACAGATPHKACQGWSGMCCRGGEIFAEGQ